MGKYFLFKVLVIIALITSSTMAIHGTLFTSKQQQGVIVLRLAENLAETNPVTVAMHKFSELVAEKTNGKVIVKVHASGQLGQQVETIEQTRLGIIDFTRTNAVVMANVSPSIGVLNLPYIFRDYQHKYQVLDGDIGMDIRNELHNIGLMGFDFLESGVRSFYTSAEHPITSIEDMKGLKIRVQPAQIMIRMIELLGAVPTPMNFGEVYSSLSQGVVDGAENDFVSYLTTGHFEVAGNYVEDGHMSPPAMLLMNLKKFKSLPEKFQQAISEAAAETAAFERQLMNQANHDAKATLLEKGVSITSIDNGPFRQAMQPIYDEFPMYRTYIERIKGVK